MDTATMPTSARVPTQAFCLCAFDERQGLRRSNCKRRKVPGRPSEWLSFAGEDRMMALTVAQTRPGQKTCDHTSTTTAVILAEPESPYLRLLFLPLPLGRPSLSFSHFATSRHAVALLLSVPYPISPCRLCFCLSGLVILEEDHWRLFDQPMASGEPLEAVGHQASLRHARAKSP